MSRYCKKCGAWITFQPMRSKEFKWFMPVDADPVSKNYGNDHREVCVPNLEYIKKRRRLIEDIPLQIGEDEFV